jgi:O-antigen/teichoic acid export membrane protein
LAEEAVVRAARGGFLILAGGLLASLLGLVYWLIMPRLAGLEAVGKASAVVSAAGVAVALVSSGLPLAALRESASGIEGFIASLVAATPLAVAAGLLALLLAYHLSLAAGLASWAAALAITGIFSAVLLQGIVGLGFFAYYATATFIGSLAKLLVGTALAILGLSVTAVLAGYLTHPITAAAIAGAAAARLVLKRGSRRHAGDNGLLVEVRRVLLLTAGNYPTTLSQQLPLMLNVYLYALLGGTAVKTGALYIALMVSLVIAMIPGSLTTAALPVGEQTGYGGGLIANQLRLGLALAAPLAAAIAAAPYQLLAIIKPQLAREAWQATAILALAAPPVAAVGAAVLELNRQRRPGRIALVGAARLLTLLALLPLLVRRYGVTGAALAFLLANLAAIPSAWRELAPVAKHLLWASIPIAVAAVYTSSSDILMCLTLISSVRNTAISLRAEPNSLSIFSIMAQRDSTFLFLLSSDIADWS